MHVDKHIESRIVGIVEAGLSPAPTIPTTHLKPLSFEATLLISFNNIALQDEEDDHQGQDRQRGTDE
jgi:hypothetical protein